MSTYFNPGRYWGKLKQQQLGKTKNGNPQIVLTFDILGKIDLSDPDGDLITVPAYDRTVFRVITEKTIDWVLQDMEALGFEGNSFGQIDPSMPNHQNLVGKELALYCEHKEYEGKMNEQWGIYSEGGGVQVKPMEPQEVRKLDALFGKALKERVATKKSEPVKADVAVANQVESEEVVPADLPF